MWGFYPICVGKKRFLTFETARKMWMKYGWNLWTFYHALLTPFFSQAKCLMGNHFFSRGRHPLKHSNKVYGIVQCPFHAKCHFSSWIESIISYYISFFVCSSINCQESKQKCLKNMTFWHFYKIRLCFHFYIPTQLKKEKHSYINIFRNREQKVSARNSNLFLSFLHSFFALKGLNF